MSKDCVPTTARRTRISQLEDANERCKASNRPNLLSASFLFMRRSTTHSMFNGIWSADRRIDGFEPLRINLGAMQQRRQHKSGTSDLMFGVAHMLSCQCRLLD